MIFIKNSLSKEETNIIQIMWDINKRITPTELINEVEKRYDKKWAKQTMNTILSRMIKKGVVTACKEGRNRYYTAISVADYEEMKAKRILDTMYNGSIENFLVALYHDKNKINKDDLKEINEWLSKESLNAKLTSVLARLLCLQG